MNGSNGRRRVRLRYLLIYVLALAAGLFSLVHFGGLLPSQALPDYEDGTLRIHYLDVGQADCTFFQLPDGRTMLIDAGTADMGDKIVAYIQEIGVETIDYVIATHPHADHIGGLTQVMEVFDIGALYMPWVSHSSQTFETVLEVAEQKNMEVRTARAGVVISDEDDLRIELIAPVRETYARMNDYSACTLLHFRERSFIFMADAEQLAESLITADVSADVYRIGHHGSHSSTSEEFLDRVDPEIAIISVGKENPYGHPSVSTLQMLRRRGITVYRTDTDGDIVLDCDGVDMEVYCQNDSEAA